MLKGFLEAERETSLVTGPREAFREFFQTAARDDARELLQQHNLNVVPSSSAKRGLMLARRQALTAADKPGGTFALIPNAQLASCLPELTAMASAASLRNGGLCVILEDNPRTAPAMSPQQLSSQLGVACLEPGTVGELRDAMEHAMRLSRAGGVLVAVAVHHSVLKSSQTIEAKPNRIAGQVENLLGRRRRQRFTESGGVLRMARRLELNTVRAMPSPGERVPVGLMTVGPADLALRHLTNTLRLHGRVPVLRLGLVNPLDDALLERFLSRCQHVMVLESRPGTIEASIALAAETMRHNGSSPAAIWGRTVPPTGDEPSRLIEPEEHLHPSSLARNIAHLLHPLRPTLRLASRLHAVPPPPALNVPPRGAHIGEIAARESILRMLAEVDQRLREDSPEAQPGLTAALSIDGGRAVAGADRVIAVETWPGAEFREAGTSVLADMAASIGPQVGVVIDLESGEGEIERFVRSNAPSTLAEQLFIVTVNFNERAELRDRLRQAVLADACTILIVRDGPPPQFSLPALDAMLEATDQLGFEPRQWLIRPAEQICAVRQDVRAYGDVSSTDALQKNIELNDGAISQRDHQHQDNVMRSTYSVTTLSKRQSSRRRVKVQPLLEQIEVLRTRPPAWIWRSEVRTKPDTPQPIHGRSSAWRVHIAGYRGTGLGLVTQVLCKAGQLMGYDVSHVHEPTHIAAGRRAWSQVLFGQQSSEAEQPRMTTTIPFGEADVLLGLDCFETLRSVGPAELLRVAHQDHTSAVVNCGTFHADMTDVTPSPSREALANSLRPVTREDDCMVENFAAACRTWFYTDRVTDLAMLGAAYQRGLVPVHLDAIETALRSVERDPREFGGAGRALEAFAFGRCLVVDGRLLRRPRSVSMEEDLGRVTRRMVLSVRGTRWGGRVKARKFERLLQQCLTSTPGLSETAPGRQARRDMVAALYRCLEWGGHDYAARYGQLLMDLYRADRGDTGRCVTRDAVLPLAEAMLVRDPVYIACMAASLEQRRRFRLQLNVKQARGDRVERRYLTRLEVIAFRRRFRADIRTSDWPARMAKASRFLLPHRVRGTRRDREVRDFMIDLVQRARHECQKNYEPWSETMQRMHLHAEHGRLRDMAAAEIRMLAKAGSAGE